MEPHPAALPRRVFIPGSGLDAERVPADRRAPTLVLAPEVRTVHCAAPVQHGAGELHQLLNDNHWGRDQLGPIHGGAAVPRGAGLADVHHQYRHIAATAESRCGDGPAEWVEPAV